MGDLPITEFSTSELRFAVGIQRAEIDSLRARVAELEASLDKSVAQASKFYDDYQEIAAEHYRHERVCAGTWVPVGERLPHFAFWVSTLVTGIDKPVNYYIGRFMGGHSEWMFWHNEVTHWLDAKLPTSSGEEV